MARPAPRGTVASTRPRYYNLAPLHARVKSYGNGQWVVNTAVTAHCYWGKGGSKGARGEWGEATEAGSGGLDTANVPTREILTSE